MALANNVAQDELIPEPNSPVEHIFAAPLDKVQQISAPPSQTNFQLQGSLWKSPQFTRTSPPPLTFEENMVNPSPIRKKINPNKSPLQEYTPLPFTPTPSSPKRVSPPKLDELVGPTRNSHTL
jgi:hypothetical protein